MSLKTLSDFASGGCLIGEMHDQSDEQLLREYAEHGMETAFREIVVRHTAIVYSSALRQVGSSETAQDVAQNVFTDLARKAKSLSARLGENASLLGWLYRSTRYAALNQLRDDGRRQARERQVMQDFNPASETAPEWENVKPILDEAMADLSEEDREVLLLRYFQSRDFRAIGQSLGVSDDTAQKRVSRSLERLRAHLTSRGVTTTTVALSTALSVNAVSAVPVGLATTLSTIALSGTITATIAAATVVKTIAMTTLQKTLIIATLAVAVGTGIYQAREASTLRNQNQLLQRQQAPLAGQIQQLQMERDDARNRLASLQDDFARLNKNNAELVKLRGESGKLRTDSKELARIKTAQGQADKSNSNAQNNFLNFAMAQTRESMTNSALAKVEKMKKTLGLNADQERDITTILLSAVGAEIEAGLGNLTGDNSNKEVGSKVKNLRAERESKILALLTPKQQLAYEEMKKEQIASNKANLVKSEVSTMKRSLHLSPEQADAVSSILVNLPSGQGGKGDAADPNAKAQLEIRLQSLSQTLTPNLSPKKIRRNRTSRHRHSVVQVSRKIGRPFIICFGHFCSI